MTDVSRVARLGVASLAIAGALVALAACSSSTAVGQGSGPSNPVSSGAPSSPDFPSQSGNGSGGPVSPSVPTNSVSLSTPPYKTVTVQGTTSGKTIRANVYDSDDLTSCAGHAYGKQMIAFLRKHPCLHAHRVLFTVNLDNGKTAVMSAISASFGVEGSDPYAAAGQFVKLEKQDGTGSINDLLREGHPIPGIASSIPSNEVFDVFGQDNSATVFDAWYAGENTNPKDRTLQALELDLFLTQVTSG